MRVLKFFDSYTTHQRRGWNFSARKKRRIPFAIRSSISVWRRVQYTNFTRASRRVRVIFFPTLSHGIIIKKKTLFPKTKNVSVKRVGGVFFFCALRNSIYFIVKNAFAHQILLVVNTLTRRDVWLRRGLKMHGNACKRCNSETIYINENFFLDGLRGGMFVISAARVLLSTETAPPLTRVSVSYTRSRFS